jgi:hypothetical protein
VVKVISNAAAKLMRRAVVGVIMVGFLGDLQTDGPAMNAL